MSSNISMTIKNFGLKGNNSENYFQEDCPEAVAFLWCWLLALLHMHPSDRNPITYPYLRDIL